MAAGRSATGRSHDKFRLGARMEQSVQLYGRRTWEHFARLWPGRNGDYARLMNRTPKRVATRTGIDATAWSNSTVIDGDPIVWAEDERAQRDVIVIVIVIGDDSEDHTSCNTVERSSNSMRDRRAFSPATANTPGH